MIDSSKPSSKSTDIEPKEAVLVSFEGRVAENRFALEGSLFQKAEGWLIVVGDSDLIPALEMVRMIFNDQI